MRQSKIAVAALALVLPNALLGAQAGYKYRDANGQWVYTDQGPPASTPAAGVQVDTFSLAHEKTDLHLAVNREDDAQSTRLIAVNDCLCVVTFTVLIYHSGYPGISDGTAYRATLDAGARQTIIQAMRADSGNQTMKYGWQAALGSPDAVHRPAVPYRVPYGVGSTFPISQAYPSRITHTTPESQYAIDIALPDGTPVDAAREGTVINARHDFYRDAMAPVMLDQANVVEILHSDGTIAVYAHLHWDSIRVRIGEHVARGQYIADSGKTGFASGPHLHFAVLRNAGGESVSVPIQFAGIGGAPVTPATDLQLTAY
jgi:murein DD-endopeptidase MepM/ murein hydrolase activator NlpD